MKPRIQTLKPRLQTLKPTLQTLNPDSWRSAKNGSTARGYGYKWQKARESYLRLNPICRYCERDGRITLATIVDHITPHRGDERLFWDESNWQPLCKPHHDGEKARQERGQGGVQSLEGVEP